MFTQIPVLSHKRFHFEPRFFVLIFFFEFVRLFFRLFVLYSIYAVCTFSIINIYSLCWICSFGRRFIPSIVFHTLSPCDSFLIVLSLLPHFYVWDLYFSLFFCILFQLRMFLWWPKFSFRSFIFIVKQIYHKRPCLDPHTCHGPAPCKSVRHRKTMQTRCVDWISVYHFVTGPYAVHYCSIDWMIRNYKIIWCIRNICNVAVAVAVVIYSFAKRGFMREEGRKKKRFAHNYDGMCDENAVKCCRRKKKIMWKEHIEEATNVKGVVRSLSSSFAMATGH